MKTMFGILIGVVIICSGCKDSSGIFDQTYTLRGTILDSSTLNSLSDVIVGIKNPFVEDSLVFKGDSLLQETPDAFLISSRSNARGRFEATWFLGVRDTSLYKCIFAYKPGYKVWQYKNEDAKIRRVNDYTDELEIKLNLK